LDSVSDIPEFFFIPDGTVKKGSAQEEEMKEKPLSKS
jgi:hypothetical protein